MTAGISSADQILFTGTIAQSVLDGTGPASNNPSLNLIQTGQTYTVILDFAGSISGPGAFNITTTSFAVPSAPAIESGFGAGTLTVTANGANYELSLLACLTSGSNCAVGNQLTANFRILAASLTSMNAPATGLDPPHPLDLLEDDGVTDLQGTIANHSYLGVAGVPEPGSVLLVSSALAAILIQMKRKKNV